ncbi:MAG: TIGR00266 family protein [Candidatus Peribacteraceae bacterium]|nr:TIGR00266 family protein [Candidatus Peribacteraceae bacterium]
MNYEILLRPSYSALKCTLNTGESVRTESGAMLAMDKTCKIKAKMEGGAWKAVKRTILSNETFFVTTIESTKDGSEVFLAPRATGDIEILDLNNESIIIQGGSFLASDTTVDTDSHFTGWKGFLSGEGIFMIKAQGTGKVFASSFGGIIKKELSQGEQFVVDNGHIVAFNANMKYNIQKVGDSILGMITTGEGLAVTFEGPGTVYMQTRNLQTFAETLNPLLPDNRSTQGKGLLGNIFGS